MSAYKTNNILVKKHVAEFLRNELGCDLVLPGDHYIAYMFIGLCSKKTKRYDLRLSKKHIDWQKDVQLVPIQFTISGDMFLTYGYDLTLTNELIFRRFLEEYCNAAIKYSYLSTKALGEGVMLQTQVDVIRQVTGINEDAYSKEGMVKKLYRNFRKKNTPNQLNLFS